MPQMAPISWLTLFSIFSTTLIFFSLLNYYLFNLPPSHPISASTKNFTLNWKW
uniref:ATP synthase complex subunit 8 n=1 Tax=Furcilarnaca wufengensis TaxID=2982682 RepID=A0A977T7I9_9ORTH|nr:ATP synthase F0 subunit 8 [Furcilarnaca wufengensis]UXP34256.1 ATP synthase F0 subunit 8 [Furcilarnaca wufengensis]UXP34338.1 ATP synthase F0 subunit 8 [Furcilarnaca wufengensis]UYA97094.1 ATP synthase F0 subunit 8 [Furcilarnaca wufengensis]